MTELQVIITNLKGALELATDAVELISEKIKKTEDIHSHKWEHGDVFENRYGNAMICIEDMRNGQNSQIRVYCLTGPGCDCTHSTEVFLEKAKFLFNIKERL